MGGDWKEFDLNFFRDGKPQVMEPNITNLVPCIAFKADLEDVLFPHGKHGLEFLPFKVEGKDWKLLNCLNSIDHVDEKHSILHRNDSGIIFMVQRLVLNDLLVDDIEFFTLEKSNRSSIFVTELFVNRVKQFGLKGLQFRHVGEVSVSDPLILNSPN